MVINTYNELSYNNSKLVKRNCKTSKKKNWYQKLNIFKFFIFLLIFFHLRFLMNPLNKISRAVTVGGRGDARR